jgi:hypothetical protein
LPPTASLGQIIEAYNVRRAQLIAADAEDSSLDEQLHALEEAYREAVQGMSSLVKGDDRKAADTPSDQSAAAMQLSVGSSSGLVDGATKQIVCPICGALNPAKATVCLSCEAQIARPCPKCGYCVLLSEAACPRCEAVIPEYDRRRLAEALAVEKSVTERRILSDAQSEARGEIYRVQVQRGTIFWIVAIILLCVLSIVVVQLYSGVSVR